MKCYSFLKLRWLSLLLVFILVSTILLFILLGRDREGTLIFFSHSRGSILQELSFSRAVYDSQHRLLRLTLSQDEQYRLYTPLNKISLKLIKATLLQEDQYFYYHPGVNPWSLIKAFWHTYILHTRRIGASTITMQVARMRYHIQSKTYYGKLQQLVYALFIDARYSKNEILEAYFNLAPYGANIQGVGAASLIYFGKSAIELSLSQAITLSVIPQNPTHREPRGPHFKKIRDHLFARYFDENPDSQKEFNQIRLPLHTESIHQLPFLAPHFVDEVLQNPNIKEQEIITTLDLRLQRIIESVTKRYLARKEYLGIENTAVLFIDTRDMGVKALLGSGDFFNETIQGQINGTVIKRSPGSSLKPFIYALALDQGLIHPATILKDVPHTFGNYNPENFDYDFIGPIKAKDALRLSRNIPAIDLLNQLNPNLYDLLLKANIRDLKSESYYGLALGLGGVELTLQELGTLYAMLANEGMVRAIRLTQEEPSNPGVRLLSREASFLVLDMLKNSNGISFKTGTSSGFRDAIAASVYGPYVLIVWFGNFDNHNNQALVGKTIATPLLLELWNALQIEIGHFSREKDKSLNLIQLPVCKASGMLPTRYCHDTELTWFIPGKSPIKTDTIYREIAIDKKSGLRSCQINQNTKFEIYEFWSSDLLRIFKQAGIARRQPPPYAPECRGTINSNAGQSPNIISPRNEMTYVLTSKTDKRIPLTAVTDGDVNEIFWFINESYAGKVKRGQTLFWAAKPGTHVVRVVDDHGRADVREFRVSQRAFML